MLTFIVQGAVEHWFILRSLTHTVHHFFLIFLLFGILGITTMELKKMGLAY
jgi:hypothetical protein